MKRPLTFLAILAAAACSSAGSKPTAPPPVAPAPVQGAAPAAATSPQPLSRTDPDIIEETETYYIKRLPKSQYIKIDDRHVKHPLVAQPVEFFKEDADYYYISVPKMLPEEAEVKEQEILSSRGSRSATTTPELSTEKSLVPLSDFQDLSPARVPGRIHLEEVRGSGLPDRGMWRASFAVADVNGDGKPDIVAPTSRLGDGDLHIWLGDGKGHFQSWPLRFTEGGQPLSSFSIDYGGVAVGDIDGDGHMDVVAASHGNGLVALFGDGQGTFRVVRAGLPQREFSAQAVVLLDADGDGKLDIVASRDVVKQESNQPVDKMQVRVYLYRGEAGWELRKDGIVGGFYSNSLASWDYDGDGRKDVLTGSHYLGALTLLWKNQGNGDFAPVSFPAIEIYAYHFVSAPGTFGNARVPAFADSFFMSTNIPETAKANGITVYAFQDGAWSRHRVWRKKDPKASVFGMAMGDLDGDGLDDIVFADTGSRRLRIVFQQADGSFVEAAESEEPVLDSPGQCIRLADLDGDGRLDVVLSETVSSIAPGDPGGWKVYLNRH
jgi:hypothetical protein